jgi:hypothetical protein
LSIPLNKLPCPSLSSAAAATGNPTASALTPNSFANNARGGPASGSGGASAGNGNVNNNNNSNSHNSTTVNPISAEEDYEHQFFVLRMIVLGTIGCVFSILGLIFWVYFVYLWRTWDSGKQGCIYKYQVDLSGFFSERHFKYYIYFALYNFQILVPI